MTQIQLICAVWASFSLSRTRIHLAHPTPLLNDVATMITASSRPWSSAVPWCRQQEFGISEFLAVISRVTPPSQARCASHPEHLRFAFSLLSPN
ncbi:hypothetical protein K438DRAFT_222683 [Mycena galopus ATCC 62051]|nr:hypothetical protein K438DRAFT_222683 [Mycena galopus ATCC 62051]